MSNHDDLTRRLRELGSQPVDPALASAHLTALGSVRPRRRWITRVKIAGAFAAGLVLGGTGLASAGVLPDAAQEVAYQTLGQVGIDVPPGKQRYNDPAVCPGGPYRNHGEYVRAHPDDPNAGRSPCGKPVKSVGKADKSDSDHPGKGKARGKNKSKPKDGTEEDEEPKGPNDPSPPATTESTLAPGSGPPTTTSTTTTSSTTPSTSTSTAPPPSTTTSTP
jgi:hypothetical protein